MSACLRYIVPRDLGDSNSAGMQLPMFSDHMEADDADSEESLILHEVAYAKKDERSMVQGQGRALS